MNIGPMTPRWLNETMLNICIIIGAIVGIIGIFCLMFTGLSKSDAALVAVLGAVVFFGFRRVKGIQSDYEMDGTGDE